MLLRRELSIENWLNNIIFLMFIKFHHFLFFLILFIGTKSSVFASDTTLIYLDDDWKKCKKYEATYIRKLYKENNYWIVKDYFRSKQLQMSGRYKKKNLKVKDGDFIYYYKNGQKSSMVNYVNNLKNGEYISWYKNGVIHFKGNYLLGKKTGEWEGYYESNALKSKENYVNGKLQGYSKWYFENGQQSSDEIYSNDSLIDLEYWEEDGSKLRTKPLFSVDPIFGAGSDTLTNFLIRNIVYPAEALEKGIKGKVYIAFVVEEDGSTDDVRVARSANPLLDREAVRVVESFPKWIPAKEHNLPVRYRYLLPITFKFE